MNLFTLADTSEFTSLFWQLTKILVPIFVFMILFGIIKISLENLGNQKGKKKRSPSSRNISKNKGTPKKSSSGCREDSLILHTPLKDLNWAEFERLLYLYFRDQGFEVIEQGIGGKDGGVDLILINRRTNERTAVQAKHWSHGPVGPSVIRELDSARKNVNCLFSWIITSNDITSQAREEANNRHMKYWHGAVLERNLEKWGKWEPPKRIRYRSSQPSR
ncbi:restriction endonuclease [Alicyclobacillaceae bacterium I2511]|nr:restriction endonuclease [Alicyclobacillaceae bacterium I2511]